MNSSNLLMAFHKSTSYTSLTFFKDQPLSSSPYFPQTICLLKASISLAKCRFHLQRRALLRKGRCLTPKPPFTLI